MSFSSSKSQFRTKIYKENIAKNKIPKTSEKQATRENTAKAMKTSDISLVFRDIGNTASGRKISHVPDFIDKINYA